MSGCLHKEEEVDVEVIENPVIEEESEIIEEEIAELPEFETILEYMDLVANDETDQYAVEKPDNYEPILFGDNPTIFGFDGVPATYIILVDKDLLNNSQLDDIVTFYLEESAMDGECYFDLLDGVIEESECPDLITWYGPFAGKAFEFVQ